MNSYTGLPPGSAPPPPVDEVGTALRRRQLRIGAAVLGVLGLVSAGTAVALAGSPPINCGTPVPGTGAVVALGTVTMVAALVLLGVVVSAARRRRPRLAGAARRDGAVAAIGCIVVLVTVPVALFALLEIWMLNLPCFAG